MKFNISNLLLYNNIADKSVCNNFILYMVIVDTCIVGHVILKHLRLRLFKWRKKVFLILQHMI